MAIFLFHLLSSVLLWCCICLFRCCIFQGMTKNAFLQFLSPCVVDLHILMDRHSVPLFFEGNPPFQKEAKSSLHWMAASLHHNEVPLGNRSQLVWCHQGALHHLQRLAGIILALAHRAGLHRAGAEVLGQHFGSLAAGRKTAKDRILTVVLNNLAALLTVVLFKLSQRLDDRHQGQSPGAPGGE